MHQLHERGRSITTAESCTGGGVAAAITDIPGSSRCFAAAFVTYSNRAKADILGVPKAVLKAEGAVSAAVVEAMALGALERARADMAISLSGIAGPGGGSAERPVGTVWMAWCIRDDAGEVSTHSERCHFDGDRTEVRSASVQYALAQALSYLTVESAGKDTV